MENQMQIFENKDFGKVRVVEIDGVTWFVGKDVTDILAYQNNRDALRVHVDDEDKSNVVIHDGRQNRKMVIINESGLYSLILSSKLPAAKAFKRWVTSEILPSVRRNGLYVTDDALKKLFYDSEFANKLFSQILTERKKKKRCTNTLKKSPPKRGITI